MARQARQLENLEEVIVHTIYVFYEVRQCFNCLEKSWIEIFHYIFIYIDSE